LLQPLNIRDLVKLAQKSMDKNKIAKKAGKDGKGGPWDVAKKVGNAVETFTGGKEIVQKLIPGGKDPSWKEVGSDMIDVGGTALGALTAGLGGAALKGALAVNKARKIGKFGKAGAFAAKKGVDVLPKWKNIKGAVQTAREGIQKLGGPSTTSAKKDIIKKAMNIPLKPGYIPKGIAQTVGNVATKTKSAVFKPAWVEAAETAAKIPKAPGLLQRILKKGANTAGAVAKTAGNTVASGAKAVVSKASKTPAVKVAASTAEKGLPVIQF
jgi:hypothetical protein